MYKKLCTLTNQNAVYVPFRSAVFGKHQYRIFSNQTSAPNNYCCCCTKVVVVVDSHIQRIVLATEETTVTQQVSHRPVKCQSRLWSQRGTKVNGSHLGDNPLLRPTGIHIATKSYAALQAMAPTNIKMVHQTSLLHIESNLDRLGMLSPTHDQRSQQTKRKNYAPTSFDQQVQDSQGHTL